MPDPCIEGLRPRDLSNAGSRRPPPRAGGGVSGEGLPNGAAGAFGGRLRRSHQPVSTRRLWSLGALGGDRAPAGVGEGGRLVGCRAR
jgi:hypothetical protein